jgi:aerobic carbon-monoxide dehydrogenase medium subunit
MIPPSFEYFAPMSLPEALDLLHKSGENAKILAGGQSLIPVMKLRLGQPSHLIDLNGIGGLSYIKESGGMLRIGAMTRMADLESSSLLKSKYGILHDAAMNIADPLVRNRGTAGGNVSHADPANDLPAAMLALEAQFTSMAPGGATKTYKAIDFFLDSFTTALSHDEILTEIEIPAFAPGNGGAYMKLEKRVGDFAIVGVAAQIALDRNGSCVKAGIGLTSVGATALKATDAENYLKGKSLTDASVLSKAGELASGKSNPTDDLRGPADYKKEMVKVFTIRALKVAQKRASGGVM